MKLKQLCLATILFIVCCSANAQFKFGAKAGLVHSSIKSKTEYKANACVNISDKKTAYFSGGIIGEYWFNKTSANRNFSLIHAELKWTRRGAALFNPADSPVNAIIDKEVFYLDYLELPVTYGYSIGIVKDMRTVLRGGAYLGCGIGGKRRIESELSLGEDFSAAGSNHPFEPFTVIGTQFAEFAPYNRLDAGMTFGVDLFYDRYFFSCDYQHGFTPIISYNKAGKIRNRNLQFSIGVIF
ncbi:MAG: porin family protein [Bacteroidales bacterium]|jgi:hypothetical protein